MIGISADVDPDKLRISAEAEELVVIQAVAHILLANDTRRYHSVLELKTHLKRIIGFQPFVKFESCLRHVERVLILDNDVGAGCMAGF